MRIKDSTRFINRALQGTDPFPIPDWITKPVPEISPDEATIFIDSFPWVHVTNWSHPTGYFIQTWGYDDDTYLLFRIDTYIAPKYPIVFCFQEDQITMKMVMEEFRHHRPYPVTYYSETVPRTPTDLSTLCNQANLTYKAHVTNQALNYGHDQIKPFYFRVNQHKTPIEIPCMAPESSGPCTINPGDLILASPCEDTFLHWPLQIWFHPIEPSLLKNLRRIPNEKFILPPPINTNPLKTSNRGLHNIPLVDRYCSLPSPVYP